MKKISEDTAILAWQSNVLPEGLPQFTVLGWDTVKVRQYIQRPMRCYFCQKYGHVATCRKKTPICGRCAAARHLKEDCTATIPTCAACQGPYETSSSSCEAWKQESTITKIKQEQKIFYAQVVLKLQPQSCKEDNNEEDSEDQEDPEDDDTNTQEEEEDKKSSSQ